MRELLAVVALMSIFGQLDYHSRAMGSSDSWDAGMSQGLVIQRVTKELETAKKYQMPLSAVSSGILVESCSDRVSNQTLPWLIQELSKNPEAGLRPLIGETLPVVTMPGLDEDLLSAAFRGRRIALVGDSTLFYLTKWLDVLLLRHNHTTSPSSPADARLDAMSLSAANAHIRRKAVASGKMLDDHDIPGAIVDASGHTHIQWIGAAGPVAGSPAERLFRNVWAKMEYSIRPEVIVANMGLHWLHLCGGGRCPKKAYVLNQWIHYEEAWLQVAVDKALQAGARLLLFKTTNFVCDVKYTGAWQATSQLYDQQDAGTIQNCIDELTLVNRTSTASLSGKLLSEQHIHQYCRFGTLNEAGANRLNQRMFQFVKWLQNDDSYDVKYQHLTVGIFNDHDVESCAHTAIDDGRHYHESMLLRIRLLGNTIQNWESCMSGGVGTKETE